MWLQQRLVVSKILSVNLFGEEIAPPNFSICLSMVIARSPSCRRCQYLHTPERENFDSPTRVCRRKTTKLHLLAGNVCGQYEVSIAGNISHSRHQPRVVGDYCKYRPCQKSTLKITHGNLRLPPNDRTTASYDHVPELL